MVEASSTLLLRFITMELLSRRVVEFFLVVVYLVNDLFFQYNDYVGNKADLNNYNVLLENYFHCRIALNNHNPFFIPSIILVLFLVIKAAQFQAL